MKKQALDLEQTDLEKNLKLTGLSIVETEGKLTIKHRLQMTQTAILLLLLSIFLFIMFFHGMKSYFIFTLGIITSIIAIIEIVITLTDFMTINNTHIEFRYGLRHKKLLLSRFMKIKLKTEKFTNE